MKVSHTRPYHCMVTATQRLWLAVVLFVACSSFFLPLQDPGYSNLPNQIIVDGQWNRNNSQTHILTKETTTTTTTASKEVGSAGAKAQRVAYHTVFSTDCSSYQHWQSYVLFYHILHSGQEGHVTRIASGCKTKDARKVQETFDKEIAVMAPGRFHLHFTPDYSHIKPNIAYVYFNKPYGLQHWMEQSLGYPSNHQQHDDTIIILVDPDQIFMRPFTNDFTNSSEIWKTSEKNKLKVQHGSPFAQQYGYRIRWKKSLEGKFEQIFQGPSPVSNITDEEAVNDYVAIGPPYIATAKDMYTIVKTWAAIVPRVHDFNPDMLAEMFAYNLAAAHHGLHHTTSISFMVSDINIFREGWSMVDQIPARDVCHHFPLTYYPHIIHYCQEYHLGKWFFSKYSLRDDFISCEAPLLVMPPEDLATRGYRSAIHPGKTEVERVRRKDGTKQAFMVCTIIRSLNEAAIYYKDHHCTKYNVNYAQTITFHKNMTMP